MNIEWIKNHLGRNLYLALTLIGLVVCTGKINTLNGMIGTGICALLFCVIALFMENDKVLLSSTEWFNHIISSLEDASDMVIYLREFEHPDNFTEKHKDKLLKLMKLFVKKMVEHPNSFKMIAYHDSSKKNPIEWIREELQSNYESDNVNELINGSIQIILSQPIANTATAYMMDGSLMFYNKRKDLDKYEYYALNVDRTIVPFFFVNGFDAYQGGN